MKKVLLAILSCLYLVVTSGMQVQHHYCMGHLKATSIAFHENEKCGTCGMEVGSNECCHNESQWLKVKDNHSAAALFTAIPAPFVATLVPGFHFFDVPAVRSAPVVRVNNHSPPQDLPDRNIFFCIFRI